MRGLTAMLVALGLLGAGCRNCDLVEAELRTRETELHELRAELARSEACSEALHREITALRSSGVTAAFSPEFASQSFGVKQIVLGRQTGGYDDDTIPGDEALQVFVEPRDPDGHALKAPGTLFVEALEISPQGIKVPLSSWEIPPAQLRRSWRTGLLGSGYDVILPWKNWPSTEKLRVIARFTLPDGRVFEAERDVTLRLTPGMSRKPAPPSAKPSSPGLPEVEVPLPPPRKVEEPVLPPPPPRKVDEPAAPPPPRKVDEPKRPEARPGVSPAAYRQPGPGPIHEAVRIEKPLPLPYAPGQFPDW